MTYKYEKENIGTINSVNILMGSSNINDPANEIQEVYSKAKAYDLLKEDLLINEKVFREQAENDEISDIIHGHYVALLVQAELEDKQND